MLTTIEIILTADELEQCRVIAQRWNETLTPRDRFTAQSIARSFAKTGLRVQIDALNRLAALAAATPSEGERT